MSCSLDRWYQISFLLNLQLYRYIHQLLSVRLVKFVHKFYRLYNPSGILILFIVWFKP